MNLSQRIFPGVNRRRCLLVVALAFTSSNEVLGQAGRNPLPKGQLEIDAPFRITSQSLTDSASLPVNIETATLGATYEIPAALGFSGGGAVRVWKNLAVGAAISKYSAKVASRASASLPHPFVFRQPRQIEGDVAGMTRDEMSVSLQVRGLLSVTRSLHLTVFGGPAMLSASQDVVTGINYTESYPYDSVTFRDPQIRKEKATKWGVNAGADLAYFFSRQAGIGIGIKYTGSKIELPSLSGGTIESKIGGVDLAGGLRLRF